MFCSIMKYVYMFSYIMAIKSVAITILTVNVKTSPNIVPKRPSYDTKTTFNFAVLDFDS